MVPESRVQAEASAPAGVKNGDPLVDGLTAEDIEAAKISRLRNAYSRVVTSEPLVDSGMIQVAVAIALIGFVFQGLDSYFSRLSVLTYLLSGVGCLLLYAVYMVQWIQRQVHLGVTRVDGRPARHTWVQRRIMDALIKSKNRVDAASEVTQVAARIRFLSFYTVMAAHALIVASVAMTLADLGFWLLSR